MVEIIRRRCLDGKKTFIVFIDFMKAFDKVMHEALFEKLDAMGIRGQTLDLKHILHFESLHTCGERHL